MKHLKTKLVLAGAVLCGFLYWQNNGLTVTSLEYKADIPEAFHGFKILHISDLQNKSFGKNQKTLLYKAECATPDIIVITGDLIDRNRTDIDVAMEFIKNAVHIAPVYLVSGNHEHQSGEWETLAEMLTEEGVIILDNGKTALERSGEEIRMIGLADKSVNPYYESALQTLTAGSEDIFTILLSHRPELIDSYAEYPIDLAFTGHAHGGQIRLPVIGGLFAPNQGFFPEYTSGMIKKRETTMVVSRGLGNSTFPFRIFNRPELIEITLVREFKNKA